MKAKSQKRGFWVRGLGLREHHRRSPERLKEPKYVQVCYGIISSRNGSINKTRATIKSMGMLTWKGEYLMGFPPIHKDL